MENERNEVEMRFTFYEKVIAFFIVCGFILLGIWSWAGLLIKWLGLGSGW